MTEGFCVGTRDLLRQLGDGNMNSLTAQKLLAIVEQVETEGFANRTRLTVLKKWFEVPGRLAAFGMWMAGRAANITEKPQGKAEVLLAEARTLLGATANRRVFPIQLDRRAAQQLRQKAYAYQCKTERIPYGSVRLIESRPLLLVEKALGLCLDEAATARDGFDVAAAFCKHYDSRYGDGLSGPSAGRLRELVTFVQAVEEREQAGTA